MPGAGLFSPETLHRNDAHISTQLITEERAPNQRHQNKPQPMQDTGLLPKQRSIDQRTFPSENATGTWSLTSTVFSYAEFVFASTKRSAEAELVAILVWHTRQDLTEASRLYLSPTVSKFLETWPDKKSWIDKVLSEIRAALIDIGVQIESVRSEWDDENISKRKRKFEYTLSHQKRLSRDSRL